MQDYEKRLILELMELTDRTDKLKAFINDANFITVPFDEQALMREQLIHMESYKAVLNKRVAKVTSR